MSDEEDVSVEIPEFVKKYIPGVMRGLSWAKYSKEKGKGTAMKSEAFQDARNEGFEAAINSPSDIDSDEMLKEATKDMWTLTEEFTEEAKNISKKINIQKTKEARQEVLNSAKEAARKAGLQGAIVAGWEKGWKEGIEKRASNNKSD
jgi:23S rRNA G2445 N2-methylase RlmL